MKSSSVHIYATSGRRTFSSASSFYTLIITLTWNPLLMGRKTGSSQVSGSGNSRGKQNTRRGRGRGGHGHGHPSSRAPYDDGRPESAVDSVGEHNDGSSDEDDEGEENNANLVEIDVPVAMWVSRDRSFRQCINDS